MWPGRFFLCPDTYWLAVLGKFFAWASALLMLMWLSSLSSQQHSKEVAWFSDYPALLPVLIENRTGRRAGYSENQATVQGPAFKPV